VPRVADKSDSEKRVLAKLGDVIRARRNELSMSQEALADAAKITRTHMGEVERGKRNVSVLAVVRIAAAMKVQPSEILSAAGL
jgi:transcriptional regulator with XRE-family HTH domain